MCPYFRCTGRHIVATIHVDDTRHSVGACQPKVFVGTAAQYIKLSVEVDVEIEILVTQSIVQAHQVARVGTAVNHLVGLVQLAVGLARFQRNTVLVHLVRAVFVIYISVDVFNLHLSGKCALHPGYFFACLDQSVRQIAIFIAYG